MPTVTGTTPPGGGGGGRGGGRGGGGGSGECSVLRRRFGCARPGVGHLFRHLTLVKYFIGVRLLQLLLSLSFFLSFFLYFFSFFEV